MLAEHGLRRKVRAATTHFSALSFLLRGIDFCNVTLPTAIPTLCIRCELAF